MINNNSEKIKEFFNNSNIILNKFDQDYIGDYTTFFSKFDKYIMNTLEEIYEARMETEEELILEEVADVLNYLATLYCVLMYNLNDGEEINIEDDIDIFPLFMKNDKNIKPLKLDSLYDLVLGMRRRFPERKWHKEYSLESNRVNFKSRLINCKFTCLLAMSLIFNSYTQNILDYAIKKQKVIMNL